jgi:chromate transporter
MRRVMAETNADVVGVLLAAIYDPVWTSAVHEAGDVALALLALLRLTRWHLPSWAVVILTAALTLVLF